MGRAPCCDKANVKKGPWSPEEDTKLREYIEKYGTGGNWISLPQRAGLKRCGKSCRLRWLNYLRPDIKHGQFSDAEDRVICSLFASIGSRWSIIAAQLPGRTDNDIKNYWNTKLKKKLMGMLVPSPQMQQQPHPPQFYSPFQTSHTYTNTSYLPTKNLTNFQPISSNTFNKTSSLLQPQESLVSPMHHYQGGKDNFLNFGAEPSCSSSSDGSHEYGGGGGGVHGEQIGVESWIELNQKVVLGDGGGWTDQRGNRNGFWGESALECDIEEIKQLVSTNDSNNFFI